MLTILVLQAALGTGALAAPEAWRDPGQPVEKRVADLVSRLTVAEKIGQMGTSAEAIPRFGIPAFDWTGECVHGVVAEGACIFPQAVAMAATWNPGLVREIAAAIGNEARVLHRKGKARLVYFSPVLNLARDPRWGRVQESYGEDPVLAGRLGVEFVRGLQGDDPKFLKAVAVVKHFAVYSEEEHRHSGSATVDDRALRGYYLPAFEAAVREAKAGGVMCAYNAVNGTPCCASRDLLTGILRDEWKFGGFVVSDCDAVDDIVAGHGWKRTLPEAVAAAVKAGCDLDCGATYARHLPSASSRGYVTSADLDRAVSRLMTARFRLGLFDPPAKDPFRSIPDSVVDSPAHRALALRAARESIVLLANPGGILPLAHIRSLAVIGPSAAVMRVGNYSGWFTRVVTPLDGLRAALPGARVAYARGCEISRRTPVPAEHFAADKNRPGIRGVRTRWYPNGGLDGEPVARVDAVIGFAGEGLPVKPGPDGFSASWQTWLVPPTTGDYRLSVTAPGRIRLWFDGKAVAGEWMDRPVTTDTVAVRMTAGIPRQVDVEWSCRDPKAELEFGWDLEPDRTLLREAVEAAKGADAAVVVVGTDRYTENEGADRSSLDLPGDQAMLIRAVHDANPRTVVVLECGGPMSLDWSRTSGPAVVQAWFPGEEGGTALAAILMGRVNPSGKLPLTWHESAKDLPPIDDYEPSRGRTYRWAEPVRFPFGYGLSYTDFEYSNLRISPFPFRVGEVLTAEVEVRNTGKRDGDEVVQAYVSGPDAGDSRPQCALADFSRVALKAGETKTVTLTIPAGAVDGPGEWRIMVGPDSTTGLVESFEAERR